MRSARTWPISRSPSNPSHPEHSVTIPKSVREKYPFPLEVGDRVMVSLHGNEIIIKPVKEIPADQAWFWTERWQEGIKEAEKDVKTGRFKIFDSADELVEELDEE